MTETTQATADAEPTTTASEAYENVLKRMPKEIGGPKGPEPTRYGDWEQKGRCTDF